MSSSACRPAAWITWSVLPLLWGCDPGFAYEPVGASRFVIEGETVRDGSTNLVWQRGVPDRRYDWENARAYCASLSLAGLSSGWRLPSREGLEGLVDLRYRPTIAPEPFPDTPADWFWSSSVNSSTNGAWVVYFGNGGADGNDVSTDNNVRCVR